MDFADVIYGRKSIRKYEDKKVERDLMEKLMDMTIQAPTAMNKQARTYTVIQDKDLMARLEKAMGEELGRETYNFMGAPCLVLISVPEDSANGKVDTATAMQNLYLAAYYHGLGSCWINQFKDVKSEAYRLILDELEIPADHVVYAGMILGYPAEDPPKKEKDEPIKYFGL